MFRSFIGNRHGAAAVEFALVVVPLLLFLFGTIEFARLMWTRQAMQSLAISAARCMGVKQSACSTDGTNVNTDMTKNFVISKAGGFGVPLSGGDITLDTGGAADSTRCPVAGFQYIQISYTFTSVVPQLVTVLAGSRSLSTKACYPNQT